MFACGKQHNRGQDGAGLATINLDVPLGSRYISRHRFNAHKPIQIYSNIQQAICRFDEFRPTKAQ